MDSSNVRENDENQLSQNHGSPSFPTDGPAAAKKRKLSMAGSSLIDVQLKVLQFENETLKKVVEELEEEKQQNQSSSNEREKEMIKLQDSVKILKVENAQLHAKVEQQNHQHKIEIDLLHSSSDNYLSQIKTLEDRKQELEEKNEQLKNEISTMKTIKSEIKDSVEDERGEFQTRINNLNAEIVDLKNENNDLKENIHEKQRNIDDYNVEVQNIKQEKECQECKVIDLENELTTAKEQHVQELENERQKFKEKMNEMEAKIHQLQENTSLFDNVQRENQNKIDLMKAENEELTKKNIDLANNKQALQNLTDEYKKKIDIFESNGLENQLLKLDDVVKPDSTVDISLVSCKPKKILTVARFEGTENGITLFSTTCEKSRKPYFLSDHDFTNTCFEFDIQKQFIVEKSCKQLREILPRIFSCHLTKLNINQQKITKDDFHNLVSAGKVEVCKLCKVSIFDCDNNTKRDCHILELLNELPKIKSFKYTFVDKAYVTEERAKDFAGKMMRFPHLYKFELGNIPYKFDIGNLSGLIEKNRIANYVLKFTLLKYKYEQNEIEKNEKKLLDSLMLFYKNLQIEYNKV